MRRGRKYQQDDNGQFKLLTIKRGQMIEWNETDFNPCLDDEPIKELWDEFDKAIDNILAKKHRKIRK